ncbi:9194_t:CDS:2, partial [Ambispora gerdemannii]
ENHRLAKNQTPQISPSIYGRTLLFFSIDSCKNERKAQLSKYMLQVAVSDPSCFVPNKGLLCRNHLKKCINFEIEYNESERQEILSRQVAEDKKKKGKKAASTDELSISTTFNLSTSNSTTSNLSTTNSTISNPSTSNSIIKQSSLMGYLSRPLSNKDLLHFENLILRIIVSNGLPFKFMENQETKDVFSFIAPALKLPGRKAISDRILPQSSQELLLSVIKRAQEDKIGITAACDGWTNIKQQHLFGVVFITSQGEILIWKAKDVSDQRSKTEDVKLLLKSLMEEAEQNQIKINCFVTDSAGEYAAARRQLRIEYPNKIWIPCMAHQMNLVVGDIFKESEFYQQTSKNAVRLVSYFHSSPYFTEKLQNEQQSCYEKTIALATPSETPWFGEMPTRILRQYLSYQREVFPFNPETYNQFDDNIIDFWESAQGLAPELSRLALHLFGICINAASVERLWSNMSFLHTKCRNRLM